MTVVPPSEVLGMMEGLLEVSSCILNAAHQSFFPNKKTYEDNFTSSCQKKKKSGLRLMIKLTMKLENHLK